MADFVYNIAAQRLLEGDLDLNAPADLRVLLLTTDAEDRDHASVQAIKTAGAVEASYGGYSRQALTGDSTSLDNPNDRAEYTANNITFASVPAGVTIVAAVVYLHVDGTDPNDVPVAHVDSGGFPVAGNGSDIQVQWNAEGILQASTV